MSYSFFHLAPPRTVTPDDALPGISADADTFYALIEALHAALDTFQEAHHGSPITWGDCIHATKCVTHDLISAYAEDTADA